MRFQAPVGSQRKGRLAWLPVVHLSLTGTKNRAKKNLGPVSDSTLASLFLVPGIAMRRGGGQDVPARILHPADGLQPLRVTALGQLHRVQFAVAPARALPDRIRRAQRHLEAVPDQVARERGANGAGRHALGHEQPCGERAGAAAGFRQRGQRADLDRRADIAVEHRAARDAQRQRCLGIDAAGHAGAARRRGAAELVQPPRRVRALRGRQRCVVALRARHDPVDCKLAAAGLRRGWVAPAVGAVGVDEALEQRRGPRLAVAVAGRLQQALCLRHRGHRSGAAQDRGDAQGFHQSVPFYNAPMVSETVSEGRGGAADSPLLAQLNAEQRAAVTLPPEHALILAGAGSGKTRVLTTRIAWLLQTGQVSPGGVLAVTFTNKAAKEMLARLTGMLPLNVRGMWIGTFHGLCNRFLRAHHQLAGLPQSFQILDTQDQLSAIKRVCKQHQVDEERYPPRQLQWFIAGCKEDGLRPADVPASDSQARRKVEIYQLYEDQCQREGVVDFGELMLRSYELLRDNDPLREHYRRRFRHVLVDEFQDTNRLQYAWIKLIAGLPAEGGGGAILAVGDDDQSIYAFRGARVGNMADFVREFQVQHQIKLEQNYRSHSNILDAANALISHNQGRLGKNLRTDAGVGEPVRVREAPTDFAE